METILLIVIVVAVAAYAALRLGPSKSQTGPSPDAAPDASTEMEPARMGKAKKPKSTQSPVVVEATTAPFARTAAGTGLFEGVATWGYQLQKVAMKEVAASPFDLMVIDYSKDGSDAKAFTPGDIQRMKVKPDGSRRQVIAYMSIGEAESYRYYWDPAWEQSKPGWLLEENPDWKENYSVCFWDPGWQTMFCGNPASYLDKIIAAGFDGVYLDKCDVFEDLQNRNKKVAASRADLEGDMVAFVSRLSQYAKNRKPAFAVIMQNAEVLLEHEGLRQVIDGVAKESLLYGQPGPERANPKDEITFARRALDRARSAGRTVFAVEYLSDPAKIRAATATLDGFGYIATVSDKNRNLDHLNPDPASV